MKPAIVYILIAVFLVCGCATREPSRPLVRYKHFQQDTKPPVIYFTQPFPPVPLHEVDSVEFWHVIYGRPRQNGKIETLFVVTDSDTVSEIYNSLRVHTSTNNTSALCGYVARQRWLDSSSNVLFNTSLSNYRAELNGSVTVNNSRLCFFGTNHDFGRVVHDLMEKHVPDLLARRREELEWNNFEGDTFWGKHKEPNK